MDTATAVEIWKAIYSRVLARHRERGEWLFVRYAQLLDGSGVARLGRALGAPLDRELCAAAGYAA